MATQSKNWHVSREPNDDLALRLSIGSPHVGTVENDGYIVYRGDTQECLAMLETALAQFKAFVAEQGE